MARLRCGTPRIATVDSRRVRPAAKTADPIYSTPEHAKWRGLVIDRAAGRCQDPRCKTPRRRPSRLFADHIRELRDGGAPFDPTNGLARCGSCHTRVTTERRSRRLAASTDLDRG